ncbi:hypothetical protein BN961_01756 [Afipia felis]|uniref:Uncharacterized protein n=1 Tax=Afipia felis TaxID=1035 RepID=A0A090MQ29_AFIFE|nr:hypothetical protein BN961_01756 [Afipia felis]
MQGTRSSSSSGSAFFDQLSVVVTTIRLAKGFLPEVAKKLLRSAFWMVLSGS